jgi:hypothetical protein
MEAAEWRTYDISVFRIVITLGMRQLHSQHFSIGQQLPPADRVTALTGSVPPYYLDASISFARV